MKKRYREIAAVIVAAVIFIVVASYTSSSKNSSSASFSVYNYGKTGTSLLYDTLARLGFPVEVDFRKINASTNVNSVQIVAEPFFLYYSEKDIKDISEWVRKGGRIIFLQKNNELKDLLDATLTETDERVNVPNEVSGGEFLLYSFGMGEVLTGGPDALANAALMENSAAGSFIEFMLNYWHGDNVCFNEYYHGYQNSPSLWSEIPDWLRFTAYQLILVTVLVVFFLGKRFGKPIPYYSETEREENEYLKSLANVYENARMGEIVLEAYYARFLQQCGGYFNIPNLTGSRVVELWREKKLKGLDALIEISGFVSTGEKLDVKKAANKNRMLKMIKNIERLRNEVVVKYK